MQLTTLKRSVPNEKAQKRVSCKSWLRRLFKALQISEDDYRKNCCCQWQVWLQYVKGVVDMKYVAYAFWALFLLCLLWDSFPFMPSLALVSSSAV
jgi:hypothetical protein